MSFPRVDIEISLPGGKLHRISQVGDQHSNVNMVSDAARDTNTSFDYSGRHDFGTLPILKSEGDLSLLITAVMKAKIECDSFLTSIIDEEYRASGGNNSNKSSSAAAASSVMTDGGACDSDDGSDGGNFDGAAAVSDNIEGGKALESKKAKV